MLHAANGPGVSRAQHSAKAIQEITRGVNDELSVTPDGKTLVFTRLSVQAPNEVYKMASGQQEGWTDSAT